MKSLHTAQSICSSTRMLLLFLQEQGVLEKADVEHIPDDGRVVCTMRPTNRKVTLTCILRPKELR